MIEYLGSPHIALVELIIVMDGGAGNFPFVAKLIAYLNYVAWVMSIIAICVSIELCGLHRLNRVVVKVSKRLHMNKLLYSASKLAAQRQIRRNMQTGALKYVDEHFEWNAPEPPDRDFDDDARATLVHMLRERDSNNPLSHSQENLDNDDKLNSNMFCRFWYQRRSINAAHVGHTCDASSEACAMCDSKETAVKMAKNKIKQTLFQRTPPRYLPSRWRKMLPSTLYWIRLLLLGDLAPATFGHANQQKKSKYAQENAVRINGVLKLIGSPLMKFHMVLLLCVLCHLEPVIEMLFATSGVLSDFKDPMSHAYVKVNAKREHHSVKYETLYAIEQAIKDMWRDLKDQSGKSTLKVAGCFYPHSASQNIKYKIITQTVTTSIGDVWWRFRMLWQLPDVLARNEQLPPDHKWWTTQAYNILHANLCDLPDVVAKWRERLEAVEVKRRGPLLCSFANAHFKACRQATLTEEHWHSFMKQTSSLAMSYCSQVACYAVELLRRAWRVTGGRDLAKPVRIVQMYFRKCLGSNRASTRTVYKRESRKPDETMYAFTYMQKSMRPADHKLQKHKKAKRIREYISKFHSLGLVEKSEFAMPN